VFLDRDGVLNRTTLGRDGIPRPPVDVEDLELLPGVEQACRDLRALGFALVVVTNQPDVARGTQSRVFVEAINRKIREALPIDDVRSCFHDDSDGCVCRKPKPGLLIEASQALGLELATSYLVGDRWRDIEAGRRAGCITILVGDGYGEQHIALPDVQVPTLLAAAAWIATHAGGSQRSRDREQ
jgi:D-glycero-D-manno-heptose 1,7-bisphosphate phosphatase